MTGRRETGGDGTSATDDAVLVNGRIQLRPHDPCWEELYAVEAARIRSTLGPTAVSVDHVGSTAVPGLSAKPIIDILLTVGDSTDEESFVPQLETVGYVFHLREPAWYEHRLLKRVDPPVNLHVFSDGCEEVDRMLAFRDRLRDSPDDRVRYETAKRSLATQRWRRVQDYADAKSEVIAEILDVNDG
ncbi:MAG: GrpB family protein [Acidimicrobiia bacterium]|jgi:GrpB-like predicted nucleotidyltransferase (UPF0157 family)